jgi:hypothetical protein
MLCEGVEGGGLASGKPEDGSHWLVASTAFPRGEERRGGSGFQGFDLKIR